MAQMKPANMPMGNHPMAPSSVPTVAQHEAAVKQHTKNHPPLPPIPPVLAVPTVERRTAAPAMPKSC